MRSLKNIIGYSITGNDIVKDGEIGKVDDFYLDDRSWTVRYIAYGAGLLLMEKKFLISTETLNEEPNWGTETIYVNLTKKKIENSPDKAADIEKEPHLFSLKEAKGDKIISGNGRLGYLDDFIIDNEWNIHFLIADTRKLLPGDKLLIRLSRVGRADWKEGVVGLILNHEDMEKIPLYDPDMPVSNEYGETM